MHKRKIQVMVAHSIYDTVSKFAEITSQSLSSVFADYHFIDETQLIKMSAAVYGIN